MAKKQDIDHSLKTCNHLVQRNIHRHKNLLFSRFHWSSQTKGFHPRTRKYTTRIFLIALTEMRNCTFLPNQVQYELSLYVFLIYNYKTLSV